MSQTVPVAIWEGADETIDLWVAAVLEGETDAADELPAGLGERFAALSRSPGFRGTKDQTLQTVEADGGLTALRGLGKADKLDGDRLDRWVDRMTRWAAKTGSRRLGLTLPDLPLLASPAGAERLLRRLHLASYRFDGFKTSEESKDRLEAIVVRPADSATAAFREGLASSSAIATASALCRDLGNTPANVATPEWMEEQARAIAERLSMEIEVLEGQALVDKGMGGLLAVGGGSPNPPRLVTLEWGHEGPEIALVGKGITYDSGGLSLKPTPAMVDMKYDKAGACAVLAATQAIAELNLPVRLRSYLALAENMPDALAYRPGDVITMYSGKTVEVLNTDAEGRLVLADAMTYAAERDPLAMVELSTLTGASVIALGQNTAALYSPEDGLVDELMTASSTSGDRLWRMPLLPEFDEQVQGHHSDLKNTGERWGSANSAAAFLSNFVGETRRWAHVDMAGPANTTDRELSGGAGATGFGVACLVHWARGLGRAAD